jgi:hypothetical protein
MRPARSKGRAGRVVLGLADGEGGNLNGDYQRTRIDVYLDDGRVVGVQIG